MASAEEALGVSGYAQAAEAVELLKHAASYGIRVGLRSGSCRFSQPAHALCVAVSAAGRLALSGGYDKQVHLWTLSTNKCLRSFEGHTKEVTSVAISDDERSAVSGSSDSTLRLWEIDTGRCIRAFEGHTDVVTEGEFIAPETPVTIVSADGMRVVVKGVAA
jgi:WD40 repeat protein